MCDAAHVKVLGPNGTWACITPDSCFASEMCRGENATAAFGPRTYVCHSQTAQERADIVVQVPRGALPVGSAVQIRPLGIMAVPLGDGMVAAGPVIELASVGGEGGGRHEWAATASVLVGALPYKTCAQRIVLRAV